MRPLPGITGKKVRETAREFKVGLFVLAGFALAVLVLLNLQVFHFNAGPALRVAFNYTHGLQVGAPVQLAGVPVGNVEHIRIRKDVEGRTRVEVTARIRRNVSIEKNAEVRIDSHGLLGQKYLEILPSGAAAGLIEEGDVLLGRDPVALETIVVSGQSVAKKLETSVDYLNRLMGDEEFRRNLKGNVNEFSKLVAALNEVAGSLKVVLKRLENGEGTIGRLLTDETVYNDIRDLMRDLKANPWKLLKKEKKGFSLF